MDDIGAVLDAAGAERPASPACQRARCSPRCSAPPTRSGRSALVLYGGWGCTVGDESYRAMPGRARFDEFAADVQRSWDDMGAFLALWAPTSNTIPPCATGGRARFTAAPARRPRWRGCGCSPTSTSAASCGAIHTPTLVLHRAGDRIIAVENGRWLAAHIPGARVRRAARATTTSGGSATRTRCSTRSSASSSAPGPHASPNASSRRCSSPTSSTPPERAAEVGDRRWRDVRARHEAIVRDRLARFRGQEVKTLGDGFMSRFDGPARAIRCAAAIRDAVRALGLELRAGLHTGEVEVVDHDLHGIAVAIAARVAATAAPGEVHRLPHGPRSGRRLGNRVRGPRYPRPRGHRRRLASVRAGGGLSLPTSAGWTPTAAAAARSTPPAAAARHSAPARP